ncbi:MAG TPA: hypothetical protein PKH72_03930 [Rhodoferax sp.]|jgi:hypothetical protein|nr:hypothetical protein [Rhodoferax sp.]HPW29379.1 hypothetical protein [Rhodoferax sp.]
MLFQATQYCGFYTNPDQCRTEVVGRGLEPAYYFREVRVDRCKKNPHEI